MARRSSKTLIQRIALDGGEEIRKELEGLGAEGKAAFEALTRAAAKTAEAGSELNKFIRQVKREFNQLAKAGKEVSKAVQDVGAAARHTATRVTILVGAATAAGAALFTLSLKSAEVADQVGKAAERIGTSAEELSALQFAAEQTGVANETLERSLRSYVKRLGDAVNGQGEAKKSLDILGLSATELSKIPLADQLALIADRINELGTQAERVSVADRLMSGGRKLVQFLAEGSAGINALTQRAQELGLVVTTEQAAVGALFADTFNEARRAVGALQRDMGLLFAPAFTEATAAFTEVVIANRDALMGMGEDVRDTVVPVLNDLITMLQGSDDIDTQWLLNIRDTVVEIANAFDMLLTAGKFVFDVLAGALDPVARLINTIFGTELTGRAIILFALVGKFTGAFRLLGASVGLVRTVFTQLFNLAGNVVATSTALVSGLLLGLSTLEQIFVRVADWATTTAGQIVAFFTGASEDSQGAMATASEAGEEAMGRVTAASEEASGGVSDNMQNAAADSVEAFDTAIPQIEGQMQNLERTSESVYQKVTRWLSAIVKAARNALAAVAAVAGFSGGGEVAGFAGGGKIRGSGTGTSDSNVIRVSNGEYVVRAAAVRRYGAGLMHAINSMRMPLDSLKGFAGGGLIEGSPSLAVAVPRAPAGGAGSAGRPFALHVGPEVFEGLLAPDDVADRMVQFATRAKVKRTGDMPPWY